jgi:hypothetical protein
MWKAIVKFRFILKIFGVRLWAPNILFLKPGIYDIRMLEFPVWNLLLYTLLHVLHMNLMHKKCTIWKNYFQFIILQQNVDTIKVQNNVDVLSEEDCIGVKTDEIYMPFHRESWTQGKPCFQLIFVVIICVSGHMYACMHAYI